MPLKNRNAAILGAAVAIICIIFYGYWSLMYSPTKKAIAEQKKVAEELNTKLAGARARAGQLNRIQAEMASLQTDVAELEKLLPRGRELPQLIRVFTHRAEANGLQMSTLTPSKPIAKGLYDEIPYAVSVTASFHGLGHFLTAMGKGDRLFAARNLTFTAASAKSDPSKTVNATFTLIAFKYHE